ncbi:uncharacterized protein LOC143084129 [Mytilus galloprovincialis]|uniref:uncharacterized protein LOC143084129 n=1 Tax=Mytilus galloprovincialis TaxID=29158 RepID=UPI003F7CCF10
MELVKQRTVHGNWGGWGAWNRCPVTCGGGRQISNRACNDPSPLYGGSACSGNSKKFRSCATDECPVHGNWGGWGAWNRCLVTCGGGRQMSNRACNDPSPLYGGSACSGNSKKFRSCATDECPVHGNWGGWGAWNRCQVTCGGGRQISNRACNDPSPSDGGSACSGNSKKFRSCSTDECPVNGNWGRWNGWTGCSKTCGGDRRTRHRTCNDPSPIAGGLDCNGVSRDDSSCSFNVCPVNGNWGRWNGWTGCSKTCGGGRRTRHRTCNDPSPIAGGLDCNGVSRDDSSCSSNVCPEWTNWNLWDSCTVDCGFGKRSRNRVCQHCVQGNCNAVDNKQCRGNSDEIKTCSVISCTGRLYDSLTIGCDLEQNRRNIIDWSTTRHFLRDKRNKYKGTNSYLLKILNLQYTDTRKYRCSFWNGQKHNYGIIINLNVYGAPKVTILRQSHFVQIGTTVTFVCNIESNPAISELWWTDNQAKHITDKLRYNGGNIHNHNLIIISVTDSDSGVYTCNANNTEGTSKATTTLIIGNITQTTILKDLYVAIDKQDITLECLIKTDPTNNVLYWLKNGKDLRPYLSSKYSGGNLSEQSLTLKNVDNNDAGNYTCKLETDFGSSDDAVELKLLSVHVYNPLHRNIRANDTITLQCVITGGNSVAWRRNNQIIDTTSNVRYSGGTVNTPSLTITNVTRYHSGNYTCETSYDLVKVTSKKAIQLFVKDIPLVYQSSANLQAFTGHPIQLTCVHESYPVSSAVFWIKDGEKLNVSVSKYNGSTITDPSLTIVNTDQFDAGTYVCGVNNHIGTGYGNKILLIIKDITQTTILEDLYVAIDEQDITLECLIKTDPSNKMLYWLKNEKDLKPYLSSKYSGGTLSEQSLTIKNVDNNDAGNYTCKLENQFGTSEDVVELKVLYVPLVYQSSDTIKAFTGDTIQLKCVYESYPEPSVVFWTRDGEILNISVSKYNGSTINEPSLTIVNIDQFDSGAYVCAVVNNIGTGYSSKILLLIKEKVLTSADKVPVVVGTVLSVAVFLLILFTVLVLLMKRRRVKKNQESSYETNEMINAETHAYGKTDTYHDYCNSNMKQTPATKNDISLMGGDCLLKKYNVIELTNRLNNAESLEARIRAEFMFLETNSVKVDMATNDYEIVLKENQTGVPKKEAKTLYMKQSVDDIFIFSSFPDDGNVEQFWNMIINHHIENIIMIVLKSEKTTSFCPTHEDVFKVAMLEIEMRSAEKTNDNIYMLRLILHGKVS